MVQTIFRDAYAHLGRGKVICCIWGSHNHLPPELASILSDMGGVEGGVRCGRAFWTPGFSSEIFGNIGGRGS